MILDFNVEINSTNLTFKIKTGLQWEKYKLLFQLKLIILVGTDLWYLIHFCFSHTLSLSLSLSLSIYLSLSFSSLFLSHIHTHKHTHIHTHTCLCYVILTEKYKTANHLFFSKEMSERRIYSSFVIYYPFHNNIVFCCKNRIMPRSCFLQLFTYELGFSSFSVC